MTIVYAKSLRGWRFVLFNVALGLGHIIVLFNVGAYIALLPHVTGDLGGVLPSFGTWAQTDFMISLALAFPIARWLAGRFGDYRSFIAAFIVYALASSLCAISQSLWLFVSARILLGFSGGVTLFIGQSLLLKEYPPQLRLLGLGIWGLVTLMPFTISFPIGGAIADGLGWRYLYYLNAPLALAIAGIIGSLLAGRGFQHCRARFDGIGFALLALVLGSMQTLLNMGNDFDWLDSPLLRGILIIMVVALPCFIIWEFDKRHPAFNIRLFAHRNFTIGVICLAAGFFSLQGLLSVFIVQLQVLLGYSSFLAGMAFLPMILLAVPVTLGMHKLPKKLDARLLASLNLLGFAVTFYWLGLFDDPGSFDQLFWPMLLLGFFLGSFFMPLTRLTLHGLSGSQEARASEEAGFIRIVAGALGITCQGVVLFRRSPFHQLHLADTFGGRRFASIDMLQGFSSQLENSGLEASMVKGRLLAIIKQHAAILALNDAFLLASYLFLGLAGLVWLAYPTYQRVHPTLTEELGDIRAEEIMEEP
ncbi:DHA2 family multidrug resistance protein [Candidatus Methylobacter favarea]|uniref:DHA2 family multidrug resistance protein n=1 Tax=Candidatus Methylobacter favarea TaxID=2707345 RepID=A0A8S0WQK6_9GAMM|nr:DHA2 family efflux MFS transporter permease subunit [Candidatus Methylobacter favarea]CAA9891499.1 DHA2 family multidrug resistance protein [Candidatus Methylobacter favarea]